MSPAGYFQSGKAETYWALCTFLRKGRNIKIWNTVILRWIFCGVRWHHDNLAICFMEVVQLHQRDSIISVTSLKSILVTQQSFSEFIVWRCKCRWLGSLSILVCLGQSQFMDAVSAYFIIAIPCFTLKSAPVWMINYIASVVMTQPFIFFKKAQKLCKIDLLSFSWQPHEIT